MFKLKFKVLIINGMCKDSVIGIDTIEAKDKDLAYEQFDQHCHNMDSAFIFNPEEWQSLKKAVKESG